MIKQQLASWLLSLGIQGGARTVQLGCGDTPRPLCLPQDVQEWGVPPDLLGMGSWSQILRWLQDKRTWKSRDGDGDSGETLCWAVGAGAHVTRDASSNPEASALETVRVDALQSQAGLPGRTLGPGCNSLLGTFPALLKTGPEASSTLAQTSLSPSQVPAKGPFWHLIHPDAELGKPITLNCHLKSGATRSVLGVVVRWTVSRWTHRPVGRAMPIIATEKTWKSGFFLELL